MKAIRTFQLSDEDKLLRMDSYIFESDEDSVEFPSTITITASVSPDSIASQAFFMNCESDTPLDVRISEMQHFLNVLKTMYYGS